jgi:hypothetical protein
MHFKKLLSLAVASMLTATGFVGLAAVPAQADSPATTFDFESNTVGAGGWANVFGFAENNNGWANTVTTGADLPTGSPAGGAKAIKATEGSGAYSGTNVGSVATTSSLIGVGTMAATVVFYSPTAGTALRLKVEQANDSSYSHYVTADAVTVAGWQTLFFDFSNPSSGTFDSNINYSLGSVSFDPTSTTVQTSPYFIDQVRFNIAPFDFESNTVGASGWGNVFGFSEAGNGWANTVTTGPDLPVGSPAGGAKAIKATEGAGAYSGTNVASVATTTSLIGTGSKAAAVVFYSPTAGVTLRLKVEQANDSSYSHFVTADAVTVAGWQTLLFDFSTPTSGSFDSSINYSLGSVSFDPLSTTLQTAPYFIDSVVFSGASAAVQQQQQQSPTVNYDVRLVSSQKNTASDANEWTFCAGASWCATNNYYFKMIAAGGSTTLNYVVTNHATSAAVSGATVHLRMNTAYSGSNATWSSGSDTFGAVSTGTTTDGGFITGTTNSSGEVSFTFANTNTNGEAVRTLNNATPYPSGCDSPAGQTKGALQPEVTAVSGAVVGTQYVDVLWPHISSSTINSAIAAGADGSNCTTVTSRPGKNVWKPTYDPNNKGHYPHVRLEKSFLNDKFDASWWDGVWQYRDVDTQAYLKYIQVGSTFALTYWVTDESGQPMDNAKVSLIVNANYSCSKTFFAYEGSLIGPDDCAGGGQTELPAKVTDAQGKVTFVLTNTNSAGEAMPTSLSGLPNGKELGTNIKPHVVGATEEGIDMLFAHFVEPSGAAKVATSGNASPVVGTGKVSTFTFTDDSGAPMAGVDVKYFVNGFDSRVGFARTDSTGRVTVSSTNSAGQAGTQTVAVSLTRDGKLPLTATVTLNWTAPELAVQAAGAKRAVNVKVAGAAGKTVRITIAGKTFTRVAASQNAEFSIATTAGKKVVKVVVDGKTVAKSVNVTK